MSVVIGYFSVNSYITLSVTSYTVATVCKNVCWTDEVPKGVGT